VSAFTSACCLLARWFTQATLILAVPGLWPALESCWRWACRTRGLTDAEVAASASVHGPDLIPYARVRVHEGSPLSRLASRFTGAPTAVATGRVIHLPPGPVSLALMVHELTHVLQYERVGAIYMYLSLVAQQGAGYDYGEVAGRLYGEFNPEQQATICEDCYVARAGGVPRFRGEPVELERLVREMQGGARHA
jgi:hypothetical protein